MQYTDVHPLFLHSCEHLIGRRDCTAISDRSHCHVEETRFRKLWATEKHSKPLHRLADIVDVERRLSLLCLVTCQVRFAQAIWVIASNHLCLEWMTDNSQLEWPGDHTSQWRRQIRVESSCCTGMSTVWSWKTWSRGPRFHKSNGPPGLRFLWNFSPVVEFGPAMYWSFTWLSHLPWKWLSPFVCNVQLDPISHHVMTPSHDRQDGNSTSTFCWSLLYEVTFVLYLHCGFHQVFVDLIALMLAVCSYCTCS